jgi:hypothetical protein
MGIVKYIKELIGGPKSVYKYFVVLEQPGDLCQYMETAWSKAEVESVKNYNHDTGKSIGFKWKVLSDHKTKDDAKMACENINKAK